ncbi:MAG: PEP-CTERM sorting domain-containing protein [Thiobacillus sp.]
MKTKCSLGLGLISFVMVGMAHAHVAYNTTGYDSTGQGGLDGAQPANWIGGSGPTDYTGSMDAMWFMEFHSDSSTLTASTADALSKGAAADYALAVGPKGWRFNSSAPNTGRYHGMDFGLIHLEEAAQLTITLTALASGLIPGMSFYSGWDSGSAWDRLAVNYTNNAGSPVGTTGLTYLGNAAGTAGGSSITYTAGTLAAGDYTLFIGGVVGTSVTAGKYSASFAVTPVPEPETVWMLGIGVLAVAARVRRSRLAC